MGRILIALAKGFGEGFAMRWVTGFWLVLAGAFLVGCGNQSSTTSGVEPKVATAAGSGAANTHTLAPSTTAPVGVPQPKLPTLKVWVGPHELVTEIAATDRQMAMGMMFRTNILENEAMLFVHPYPVQASFWMKNTLIPLSGAYIDPQGVIVEIHEMKALDETPIRASSNNILYVLETRHGWFERNKVTPGMVVRTERGSLAETFFKRP